MEGDPNSEEMAGMIPRAIRTIFERLQSEKKEFSVKVRSSGYLGWMID